MCRKIVLTIARLLLIKLHQGCPEMWSQRGFRRVSDPRRFQKGFRKVSGGFQTLAGFRGVSVSEGFQRGFRPSPVSEGFQRGFSGEENRMKEKKGCRFRGFFQDNFAIGFCPEKGRSFETRFGGATGFRKFQ